MRNAYHWGAKQLLTSMEVGDVIEYPAYDIDYNWDGLRQIACRLSKEYPVKWVFRTKQGMHKITRVQ
jgi:hypothetical protein